MSCYNGLFVLDNLTNKGYIWYMKTMSVGEFKTHFSEVVEQVKAGEKIAVTFGKKKEVIGYFLPELPKQEKRQTGVLEGKAKFTFSPDFEMTTEEFLGL